MTKQNGHVFLPDEACSRDQATSFSTGHPERWSAHQPEAALGLLAEPHTDQLHHTTAELERILIDDFFRQQSPPFNDILPRDGDLMLAGPDSLLTLSSPDNAFDLFTAVIEAETGMLANPGHSRPTKGR